MKVIRTAVPETGAYSGKGKKEKKTANRTANTSRSLYSGASAPETETIGESAKTETPAPRRPTYGEIMGKYYAERYADALEGNARTAEEAYAAAERDAQEEIGGIRGGYKTTDRQLYREYMESRRTLPQQLAAQGISGGLTESSQVRLADSYGEQLAENERARLSEEARVYADRDSRLASAKSEQSRADAEAKRSHGESRAKLWQEAEKTRREDAAKAAALLASAGDYSGYIGMGLSPEQAEYLAEIWMSKNSKQAALRSAWSGTSRSGTAEIPLGEALSEALLRRNEYGADAAVEYIAALYAMGAVQSDEAEELWKLLRGGTGEGDII